MNRQFRFSILVFAVFILSSSPSLARVVYINTTGDDSNEGLSWSTAKKTVQEGLGTAVSGDEVWVAAGTYAERITLVDGVGLYGGFSGAETSRDQRDWKMNVTILDGNQEGSVVTVPQGTSSSTIIDGFTIRNGSAIWGGGIVCYPYQDPYSRTLSDGNIDSSSPTISNNTITGNSASFGGGGIYCSYSSARISDNIITGNRAFYGRGGGIYYYRSSPTISNNTITRNKAYLGGGIYDYLSSSIISDNAIVENIAYGGGGILCSSSSAIISDNVIKGNIVYDYGGGIYCGISPTISNNVIAGNSARRGGGGIACLSSSAVISNNTIAGNSASHGGSINCRDSSPTILNNIMASNSSGIYNGGSVTGSPTLRNNDVFGNTAYDYSGLSSGTGDISADPLLANPDAGDYHLSAGSPCIDAGDDSAVQPDWKDVDGQSRIARAHVDIGADEVHYTVTGYVNLQDFVGDRTQTPVDVELRRPDGSILSGILNLDGRGGYMLWDVEEGDYDIAFKASHWLREVAYGVQIVDQDIRCINVSLINGDCDGDNFVGQLDFEMLRRALNTRPGDQMWNPNADLNGDGRVQGIDMSILKQNWGLSGKP